METFSIGQLASAAGVNVETVRYYERRGLLAEPPRTPAGYRQYSAADLWRMQFIARAKRLGFTLTEIADLVGDDARSAQRITDAARAKVADVDEQLQTLAEIRCRLEQLIDICQDGNVSDCAALELLT